MNISDRIANFENVCMRAAPIKTAYPVFSNSIYLFKKISYIIDQLEAIIDKLEERKKVLTTSCWFNFDVRLKYYFDFLLISMEPLANDKLNDDLDISFKDQTLKQHIGFKDESMKEIKRFNKLLRHTAAHYNKNPSIVYRPNSTMSRELIYGHTLQYDKESDKLLIKLSKGKIRNAEDLDFFDSYTVIKKSLMNYIQYFMNVYIDFIGEDAPIELKIFYKY